MENSNIPYNLLRELNSFALCFLKPISCFNALHRRGISGVVPGFDSGGCFKQAHVQQSPVQLYIT